MNLLALDYGTRKTGIAYSVDGFCFSWKTVPSASLISLLPEMIQSKKISEVIIGMPYNIDGSMSRHAKRVEKYKKELEETIQIPIILHDERLSTSEARIGFDEYGIEDGDLDAESARIILESYIGESKK